MKDLLVEGIGEALTFIEQLPHAKGCRSEFAPQICNCPRGAAIEILENLPVE